MLAWIVPAGTLPTAVLMVWRTGTRFRGWLSVFAILLAVWGALFALGGARLAFYAIWPWLLFVMVPNLLFRFVNRAAERQRYGRAAALMRAVMWLHPFDGMRQQATYYRALADVDRGEADSAIAELESLEADSTWGAVAQLQRLGLERKWTELCARFEARTRRDNFARAALAQTLYVRALGEARRVDEMLHVYERFSRGPLGAWIRPMLTLHVASLSGNTQALRILLESPVGKSVGAFADYWRLTAEQTAGRDVSGDLELLMKSESGLLRRAAEHRLAAPLARVVPEQLGAHAGRVWAGLERAATEVSRAGHAVDARPTTRRPIGMYCLVGANLTMFLAATIGPWHIVDLGALVIPTSMLGGTWWRVVAAGFLHAGAVHFAFNMLGLAILGSRLEKAWGTLRFVCVYFAVLVAGNLVAMWGYGAAGQDLPKAVVGASGAILGVVGALAGRSLCEWRRGNTVAQNDVVLIGVIMAVQVAFDLSTPMVAGVVHWSGFALGALLGWTLTRYRDQRRADAPVLAPRSARP